MLCFFSDIFHMTFFVWHTLGVWLEPGIWSKCVAGAALLVRRCECGKSPILKQTPASPFLRGPGPCLTGSRWCPIYKARVKHRVLS